MIENFKQVARSIFNEYVEAWKKSGKFVVGYPCTYVPEEIIHAAGLLPFRLRGIGISSLSVGDTYFGPVICSFPKCVLELAGNKKYSFLDGTVMSNGCDSMRRLDECWRKADKDIPGIRPGYFHYFGVPHKVTDYSLQWFEEEIQLFIKSIEEHFSISVTDQDLNNSIKLYNQGRRLLKQLDQIKIGEDCRITGEDALALVVANTAMPKETYIPILSGFLDNIETTCKIIPGRKRLMIVGSINDDLDFFKVIEDCGAVIVADSMCFGSRTHHDLVEETTDPVKALAKRYLNHAYCPRMFGYYKERLNFIKQKVVEARVDGVILQNIRFCDLHGSENGIFVRDLEAAGIACLKMEREYGPLVESGRVKMRIDAFLEKI
ncbi:MAG: 2-hydroxyacyl-CoA dehydratase [Deltaproteobacteria bacterium]|nr:2-hydroxyacyl-CoA dehydratase [Deltaproteobacteria bacterium]